MSLTSLDLDALGRLRWEFANLDLWIKFQRCRLAFKYDPNQPRVPAGNPDGGQWTYDGGGNARVAQYIPRGPRGGSGGSGGSRTNATPAQQARLAASQAQANAALRRVRELDPHWRPTATMSSGIEGEIAANEAIAQQARARLSELQRYGIGPGPFAAEWVPARGSGRDFTAQERREINRIGAETGCHTCGTRDPGTLRGNFILDHQTPNALNFGGRDQRLYPHCASCSARQGNWVLHYIKGKNQ